MRAVISRPSFVCLAVLATVSTARTAGASFMSLPLDLIQATEFGLPLPDENEIPEDEGNHQNSWLRLPPPTGSGSDQGISKTGHGADFANWAGGGAQFAGHSPFGRGGYGSGTGGWASQGVGAGPGVGDGILTDFTVIPQTVVNGSAGTGGSGSPGAAGDGGGAGGSGGGGGGGGGDDDPGVHAAPEPGGITLLGIGLLTVCAYRWKRTWKM